MSQKGASGCLGIAGVGVFALPVLAIMMFIARMWVAGIVLLLGAAFCFLLVSRAGRQSD